MSLRNRNSLFMSVSVMTPYRTLFSCVTSVPKCLLAKVCGPCRVHCPQRLHYRNVSLFSKHSNVRHETYSLPKCGHTTLLRGLHGSQSLFLSKILSVEEIFSKPLMQEYLRKVENEYDTCLKSLNATDGDSGDEEELGRKRTRVSILSSLVQQIRDLKLKQKEFEETEALLKGKQMGFILYTLDSQQVTVDQDLFWCYGIKCCVSVTR